MFVSNANVLTPLIIILLCVNTLNIDFHHEQQHLIHIMNSNNISLTLTYRLMRGYNEVSIMRRNDHGQLLEYEEQDLDFLVIQWLHNKSQDYPTADAAYFNAALHVAKHLRIIREVNVRADNT